MTHPARPRPQAGFALVTVLWVVALLATIAIMLTGLGQRMTLLVRNHGESLQAQAMADGSLRWAMAMLMTDRERLPIGTAFTPPLHWRDGTVTIEISFENRRLDLNRAGPGQVAAALRAHGASGDEARHWAQLIAARTFHAVDELLLIPSFPAALYEQAAAEFTVFGDGGVFRIVAQAAHGSGTGFQRQALVKITPRSLTPLLLLDWREGV